MVVKETNEKGGEEKLGNDINVKKKRSPRKTQPNENIDNDQKGKPKMTINEEKQKVLKSIPSLKNIIIIK